MGNKGSFKKGERPTGRAKGTRNKKTLLKESMHVKTWSDLSGYIEGRGLSLAVAELEHLRGKDFVTAYNGLTEYVKPKLARAEILAKVETNITWEEKKNYVDAPNKIAGGDK
jgi:hypothetical protein